MSDPYNNVGDAFRKVVKLPVKKRAPLPTGEWRSWENIRKIARLAGYNPKIRIDPVQVAASTLEKAQAGRIKSLFVSIVWDEGSLSCDWSEMPRSQLISHAFNAQSTVQEEVNKP